MIDLKHVNQAMYDTLKQVAPEAHFILVMWQTGTQATITSNELNPVRISRILSDAADIVATNPSYDYLCDDGFAGRA